MKIKTLVTTLVFCVTASHGQLQAQQSYPVKVGIKAQVRSNQIDSIDVQVVLLDAKNREVKASKDMPIMVQAITLPHDTASREAIVKAGQSSQRVSFLIKKTGIVRIRAKNEELLEGGIHLRATKRRLGSMLDGEVRFIRAAYRIPQPEQDSIELVYSPDRTILADGRDSAVVQAFLLGEDVAPRDIAITLFNDGGILRPNPLIIYAGEDHGEAVLTSTKQMTVKVQFRRSHPAMKVVGSGVLNIRFGPPITKLVMTLSPPTIGLVDDADLIAQLTDDNGTAIATDHLREVSFAIERGRGKLEPSTLKIDSSKYEARAKLYPTMIGEMRVLSFTPNLVTASTRLDVKFPLLLTVLSLMGGAIGGVIRAWDSRKGRVARTAIGVATGFVLYWGIVFGLLAQLLPQHAIMNPFVAVVISIAGGWAGTKVFEPILKRIGVAGA
jgi:hypothetical protein